MTDEKIASCVKRFPRFLLRFLGLIDVHPIEVLVAKLLLKEGIEMPGVILIKKRLLLALLVFFLVTGATLAFATTLNGGRLRQDEARTGVLNNEDVASAKPATARSMLERTATPAGDSFFVDFRIERETQRSRQMELLREIADAPATEAATRKEAQEKLMALSQQAERETRTENILRAKGFKDAVVAVEEGGVTVVVRGGVTPEETATIITLVYRGLGIPQEQVMIIGRE